MAGRSTCRKSWPGLALTELDLHTADITISRYGLMGPRSWFIFPQRSLALLFLLVCESDSGLSGFSDKTLKAGRLFSPFYSEAFRGTKGGCAFCPLLFR